MVINPSKTSGTSCSNNLAKNSGAVRESIITGLLFLKSTFETTALVVSPYLK